MRQLLSIAVVAGMLCPGTAWAQVQVIDITPVYAIAFSPDGRLLAAGRPDRQLVLLDTSTRAVARTIAGHAGEVLSVAFSPDGQTLASANGRAIALWDAATGAQKQTLTIAPSGAFAVSSVAFSPDGTTLASAAGNNKIIVLWDLATGSQLRVLKGHTDYVTAVAFSPDGKTLASAAYDKKVMLWDVASGARIRVLKGHSTHVVAVAFSPDGKALASGSWDNAAILWDAAKGTRQRTLKHADFVTSVAFSPDGATLAAGTGIPGPGSVVLWNTATGARARELPGAGGAVFCVAFSPDGRTLAAGSLDTTVTFWDLATGERTIARTTTAPEPDGTGEATTAPPVTDGVREPEAALVDQAWAALQAARMVPCLAFKTPEGPGEVYLEGGVFGCRGKVMMTLPVGGWCTDSRIMNPDTATIAVANVAAPPLKVGDLTLLRGEYAIIRNNAFVRVPIEEIR